jgi:hypothetical protein
MELDTVTIRVLAAIERERVEEVEQSEEWQGSSDSNRGPSVLETDALTS